MSPEALGHGLGLEARDASGTIGHALDLDLGLGHGFEGCDLDCMSSCWSC